MKIILASASPRRKELLKQLYLDFSVLAPDVEEQAYGSPVEQVMQIAKTKAFAINEKADIIISADTIVVFDDKVLGKPIDKKDAFHTLTMLSGRSHQVHTGVCIRYSDGNEDKYTLFCDTSTVKMKKLSKEDIISYVEGGSPLDKAGSYGIQDGVVESFCGSYTNIVGLPVEKLEDELKKLNLL